jgi:Mn2+/Fe2+ NRAMP family transporter
MDFKSIVMSMNFLIFVIALALLIMSAIIRGSIATYANAVQNNKQDDAKTAQTNIQRTSNLLLILSGLVLAVSGFNIYQSVAAQKVQTVAFYF